MTDQGKSMLHYKIGQRLKQLAKEHDCTREDLSEKINYSCGHISRFYNGTIEIPDTAACILAELWGVRKEYILCEDDFKTDDEMYTYLNEVSVKDMQAAIDYLKTLGLLLRPYTVLSCPLTSLYHNLSEIRCYIKDSEIQRLQSEYNFELPPEDFHKTYFFIDCNVELSSPLPEMPFLCTENIPKTSVQKDTVFLSCSDVHNPVGVNCNVTLYFKVYYQDKLIRSIGAPDFQEFIKKLDMYSKCTIETLLFDSSFGSHFLPDARA